MRCQTPSRETRLSVPIYWRRQCIGDDALVPIQFASDEEDALCGRTQSTVRSNNSFHSDSTLHTINTYVYRPDLENGSPLVRWLICVDKLELRCTNNTENIAGNSRLDVIYVGIYYTSVCVLCYLWVYVYSFRNMNTATFVRTLISRVRHFFMLNLFKY